MNSTFGMSSAEADSTAMERIMQLKRIQRRTGTMPLTPMGNDDWAGWKPEGPMSGTLDGPLTPSAKAPLSGPSPGPKQRASVGSVVEAGGPDAVGGILKALKDTVRFLRSASTEHGEFVDAQSYHAGGADLAAAMQDLLEELQALKSRDASSATVLRMAKENLEQRKEQIVKLQTELANRSQADGMQSAQMADVLKEKDLQLQDAQERERASQELIRQLEVAVRRLQADLDSRRQQDANMHELIREAETQRELHQQEMDALRDENQRLLSQKAAEMDKVLQEAAREVEDVRAAMRRQQATDAKMPTPPASAPRSVPQSGGGADTLEVERLKEALADASTDIQEREEELGAAQSQILELQQLLKQQSDVLAEVRQREEELARERGFLANEAGESSASAMQALQEQVARQKVTIATLQKQMEGFGDTETELLKCREVIAEMERHKQEVDGLLDEVQEDRSHRDAVIAELKKLRTSVQQKDSLIAELNEQLHSPNVRQESTAPSLFKVQQMQRDIQELRTAVQQRDALIAELNARMQQNGQGDMSHAGNLAERERALVAQTEQLQLVSQHQFEMQAQLAAVQKALQEQQAMMAQQAVDAQRQQQQSFQLAAQAQQLAALQQGINSIGPQRGPKSGGAGAVEALRLDAPESGRAAPNEPRIAAGHAESSGVPGLQKMPTPQEWSQSMGVQAVEEEVKKARALARSAAAAAAVARRQTNMSAVIPQEVTM